MKMTKKIQQFAGGTYFISISQDEMEHMGRGKGDWIEIEITESVRPHLTPTMRALMKGSIK